MKAYLITTGSIFALLTLAHVWRAIAEWPPSAGDPWYFVEAGVGAVAAALSLWAWSLLRASGRS
jgi:hypothetical protein